MHEVVHRIVLSENSVNIFLTEIRDFLSTHPNYTNVYYFYVMHVHRMEMKNMKLKIFLLLLCIVFGAKYDYKLYNYCSVL